MCKKQNCSECNQKVTAIQIGKNREVAIEDLLMKLATVQDILRLKNLQEEQAALGDDSVEPLDPWTESAIYQNLAEVSHALKCACFGHEAAYLH